MGKSTFSALAVRHLHESTGEVVLAVDADPNSNLGAKLDSEPGRTLGNLREEIVSRGEEPPDGMSKQDYIDYHVRLALKEGNGFDLLTMGRQEGPGCYCYINNMLRTFLDSITAKYSYVVIDNEAGMEHLSRRTTRAPNVLFILCDRSKASLDAAKRIAALAQEMKIKAVAGFDAVYGVRMSRAIQARMAEAESLMDIPSADLAFADVSKAIEAERKRG